MVAFPPDEGNLAEIRCDSLANRGCGLATLQFMVERKGLCEVGGGADCEPGRLRGLQGPALNVSEAPVFQKAEEKAFSFFPQSLS